MSVSIIIPTRNGSTTLRELLAGLTIQSIQADEIIVIDSGSEDDTVEVAASYGALIHSIDPCSFDHGETRTKAGKMAAGEILVFLTQDVLVASSDTIERLIAPFRETEEICLSYGRQLPSFQASEIAAHLREFNYPNESHVRSFADRQKYGFQTVFVSNSCAAYRHSDLADIGYFESDLIFGEDSCAAGRLLEKGGKIAYSADAVVYHSHNYSWNEDFYRYFDIGVFHQSQNWLLESYGSTGGRGLDYIRSGLAYLWRRRSYGMIGDFMVRVGLKFLGYRLGRIHHRLPVSVATQLSMNKSWWERKKGKGS
ncbi:MAG: glycosyltransferase family 2 protein [Desulfofustis sp.]|nr:glycosyltransferase family 2 protein [Desulfofustis sp.]